MMTVDITLRVGFYVAVVVICNHSSPIGLVGVLAQTKNALVPIDVLDNAKKLSSSHVLNPLPSFFIHATSLHYLRSSS